MNSVLIHMMEWMWDQYKTDNHKMQATQKARTGSIINLWHLNSTQPSIYQEKQMKRSKSKRAKQKVKFFILDKHPIFSFPFAQLLKPSAMDSDSRVQNKKSHAPVK